MTRLTGTLHEDQYIFLMTSSSILRKMRKVSNKSCRDNHKTHFVEMINTGEISNQ